MQPTTTAAPSSVPSSNPTSSGAPTLQVIIKFTRCAHLCSFHKYICLIPVIALLFLSYPKPSYQPSSSSKPSSHPSAAPSTSTQPTLHASETPSLSTEPSRQPSGAPSVSSAPSSSPSTLPTSSSIPSSQPSSNPTLSGAPTLMVSTSRQLSFDSEFLVSFGTYSKVHDICSSLSSSSSQLHSHQISQVWVSNQQTSPVWIHQRPLPQV